MPSELRAGIAGTGFIGAVHARSARLAGARIVAVAASSLDSAQRAAQALGAERAFASAEELVAGSGHRRRAHLHAEPPAPAAGRGGARRRQARHLREAAGARRDRRAAARRCRRRHRSAGRRAVRLPLLPDRARGAPARQRRADRRAAPAARRVPAGLAAARRRRQLARRRDARRPLARLRRHRLALVRPGAVHLRPSDRASVRAPADGAARAPGRRRPARVRRCRRQRPAARGHDRGRRRRPLRDRPGARSERSP